MITRATLAKANQLHPNKMDEKLMNLMDEIIKPGKDETIEQNDKEAEDDSLELLSDKEDFDDDSSRTYESTNYVSLQDIEVSIHKLNH